MRSRFLVAPAVASLLSSVTAMLTISAKGSKFFKSDGSQFYIKGIAYQLLPADPLVDTVQCQADAALMQSLGANAIRVYHVDPSLNHDGCMSAFASAGIYAFIDLDTFSSEPVQTGPTWTPAQLGAYMFVMDAFANYDNTAGFFIGNEIINQVGPATEAAPYIKAMAHDLRQYRDAMKYRPIPIGYSHADVAGLRPILQDYLVCGDQASTIEFFGLNAYEWCGADSTYESSGYAALENQTANYPVPIFFSETGCIVPEPRYFHDQSAIFTEMANTWSGAIIYEWIQEDNHYGIITYGSNTNAYDLNIPAGGVVVSGTPNPVTPDFYNLKSEWATLNPTGIASAAYTPANPTMACPAFTAGVWQVDPSAALPTLGINVAIPTASALALANYGLATYTTPVLGHAQGNLSPSTAVALVSTAAPASSATTVIPSSISSAVISRLSSESHAAIAASSSAESIRSSIQSSANSVQSSLTSQTDSSTSVPASTTVSGGSSSTTASAAATGSTGAASRIQAAGAGLAGLACGAVLFL